MRDAASSRTIPSGKTASRRTALVVAHPVHALKLFGWILEHKPVLYFMTNGSGTGPLGAEHTIAFLRELERGGATCGEFFERIDDAAIYRAILARDAPLFLKVADRIAASFVHHDVGLVVADAREGYSPAHDLCRAVADAAAAIAARQLGHGIETLACYQTEWLSRQHAHDADCIHLELDDATFSRKLEAALRYSEWNAVIQDAIAKLGLAYFRTECLRPVAARASAPAPYYEISGEAQVAAGRFQTVIRYETHMRPLLDALAAHAATERR